MTSHGYPVKVTWKGGREGEGAAHAMTSGEEFPIAVPPEFQGPGGATNPEELLTSAVASCYSITYGIIAANRKVPLEGITVEAIGEVDQQGPSLKYARVTLEVGIRLAPDATEEHRKVAEELAHKADGYCIITNALKGNVEVTVKPRFLADL